jgi:hypothetical protein
VIDGRAGVPELHDDIAARVGRRLGTAKTSNDVPPIVAFESARGSAMTVRVAC